MSASGDLIDLLVRSSLLLAMTWCAAAAVRRAGGSAAMRHMVWLLGLGALFIFPLMAALMPPLPLSILPAPPSPPAEIVTVAAVALAPAATPVASFGPGDFFQLLYLAVAAALLGRLALGQHLLARLWRRARPAGGAGWPELLRGLKTELGIRRPVALRLAPGEAMPMTWGTLRPRILLPAEAAGWTAERRRIVLMHELAHIARRDSLSRSAVAIVCAFYWFHPAIWWAAGRMRLEQEHACDDLVLSLGASARVYARSLLDVAGAFRPPPIATSLSVAMARSAELERRLTAIIRRGPRRRSSARFAAGSGAGALAATLLVATVVPVAALQPAPASAPARSSVAPRAPAPPAPVAPVAAPQAIASPAPAPRPPVAPVAPVAAVAPVAPREAAAPENYGRMVERHRRDLDVYNRQLEAYHRAVDAHRRQVAELRARGNLGNSGNTGNSGNSGNFGNPGRPAHEGWPAVPPTPPTPPIAPTMPTPPMARYAPEPPT